MAQQQRSRPGAFQGAQPLVAQTAPSAAQPQRQRQVDAYYHLDRTRLNAFLRKAGLQPLAANPTPAQREQALRGLFEAVRVGGCGGLRYQAGTPRRPRTPDEVLRTGSGDCDELCGLFIAVARELRIPLGGAGMVGMWMSTNKPGDSRPEPHAAIAIQGLGGKNYLFDFVYGRTDQVRDFSIASLDRVYRGLMISPGRAHAGFPIISVSSAAYYNTPHDMAAHHYVDEAEFFLGRVAAKAPTRARDMSLALQALRRAAALAPTTPSLCMSAFSASDSLGDAALQMKSRVQDAQAIEFFRIALGMYGSAPAASRATKSGDAYEARLGLGIALERLGRRTDALREYATLIRTVPANENAYLRAYRLMISAARRARTSAARRGPLTEAYKIARAAVRGLPAGTFRTDFQAQLGRLEAIFRRYGWPAP
jgi:tetratricopeptide (TPR) repeat protein